MTKICVLGAGAIGGLIGAKLARKAEADISLIARGAHLAAMERNGLTLKQDGESFTVRPRVAPDAKALGPQDFVIVAVKANALTSALDQLQPLLGKDTAILFAQNCVPWWYFHKHGGPHEGRIIESVDPGGEIWKRVGPERALGSVVWQAASLESPGVIAHQYGERMPIAEPSGEKSERAQLLSKILMGAGIKAPVRGNLRDEIWLKLWGNLSFNPVSVLTLGTLDQLATNENTRRVILAMMQESRAVGEALGVKFTVDAEERMDMAAKVGNHRTSMLQDVEAGRPTELDCLLGAVIELAQLVGISTPTLNVIYDLTKFRSRM
jgi:2-dehydropantoate 2-reductase